ncbi:hypothetical protein TNCV_1969801 [Trichonephila clavipes]|nr:hypothetical protein TNCV_1969801 [Trichonephila clavipes]
MSHKNRKRKFTGNQYRNKRSSIDTQAKNDTTVASNIELKTASASKLEDLKDNFLESSGYSDEIFGHQIFDVTTLLSVFTVLCCPVCLHDELSLKEDSRKLPYSYEIVTSHNYASLRSAIHVLETFQEVFFWKGVQKSRHVKNQRIIQAPCKTCLIRNKNESQLNNGGSRWSKPTATHVQRFVSPVLPY